MTSAEREPMAEKRPAAAEDPWLAVLHRVGRGLGHELNNQLAVVITYCELLLEGMDSETEAAHDVETMRGAAAAGAEALRAFDILARPASGTENTSLEALVRRLERPLGYLTRGAVRTSLESSVPSGALDDRDVALLEHSILMAASAVGDALPAGGGLDLVVRGKAAEGGPTLTLELRGVRQDPDERAAGDDGPGGHEGSEPTLPHVKELVRTLGGRFDAERPPEGGLVLRIEVPISSPTVA